MPERNVTAAVTWKEKGDTRLQKMKSDNVFVDNSFDAFRPIQLFEGQPVPSYVDLFSQDISRFTDGQSCLPVHKKDEMTRLRNPRYNYWILTFDA